MWEISHRELIFSREITNDRFGNTVRQTILSGGRPEIFIENAPISRLISVCWAQNPLSRPPASDIYLCLKQIARDNSYLDLASSFFSLSSLNSSCSSIESGNSHPSLDPYSVDESSYMSSLDEDEMSIFSSPAGTWFPSRSVSVSKSLSQERAMAILESNGCGGGSEFSVVRSVLVKDSLWIGEASGRLFAVRMGEEKRGEGESVVQAEECLLPTGSALLSMEFCKKRHTVWCGFANGVIQVCWF